RDSRGSLRRFGARSHWPSILPAAELARYRSQSIERACHAHAISYPGMAAPFSQGISGRRFDSPRRRRSLLICVGIFGYDRWLATFASSLRTPGSSKGGRMIQLFVALWTMLVFLSHAGYGLPLFFVGF